jgi:hypothetical protein
MYWQRDGRADDPAIPLPFSAEALEQQKAKSSQLAID